eukprot:TRINITY_DN84547_c0_g1_i1.p1 TRINITY_DN84547_c0_g1~~TRINITY_DN84547_c0_g1_i1.p1  ORF type:complete len:363 (-),score=43.98 TRINITY_DN84547_c0_g1_i1:100-1140(-)
MEQKLAEKRRNQQQALNAAVVTLAAMSDPRPGTDRRERSASPLPPTLGGLSGDEGEETAQSGLDSTQAIAKRVEKKFRKHSTRPLRDEESADEGASVVTLQVPSNSGKAGRPQAQLPDMGAWMDQLLKSPLFQKICAIEDMLMDHINSASLHFNTYVDDKDRTIKPGTGLKVLDNSDLTTPQFVAVEFGKFVVQLLKAHDDEIPSINIFLASSLPGNKSANNNAFRNSFHFDTFKKSLYIHQSRLGSTGSTIGDFLLVIVHCLAHIKTGDIATNCNDTDPVFLKEFYAINKILCEELFFGQARAIADERPPLGSGQLLPNGMEQRLAGDRGPANVAAQLGLELPSQ